MEEDYQKALKLIVAYGYGCCAFKHNICRDRPEIPDDMPNSTDPLPLEFFINPRCPQAPAAIEAKTAKVDLGGTTDMKPRENSIFLKKGKTIISVKTRNFSRSRMTKRISPLESSRKI